MPSSLVQAPLSSGSFLEVGQGTPHLPGFHWGVGIWSGIRRRYPPPLSAFLVFNRVVSKRKSRAQGRERRGCPSFGSPFPNVCPSRAAFFQERPLDRVSEPALHTETSPSVSRPTSLGLVELGKEASCFLLVSAGQLCSPLCPPWQTRKVAEGERTLQALDDPAQRGCLEAGTPGPLPAVQGTVCQPPRPGLFRSPWH